MWTTTPERAKHLLTVNTESFVDAVNDALVSHPSFCSLGKAELSNEMIKKKELL